MTSREKDLSWLPVLKVSVCGLLAPFILGGHDINTACLTIMRQKQRGQGPDTFSKAQAHWTLLLKSYPFQVELSGDPTFKTGLWGGHSR